MADGLTDRPLVLVTGASGYIGGRLIPELVRRGYRVRAMARDVRKLERRVVAWGEVEAVQGDVFDFASLIRAFEGVEYAYYLIHSIVSSGEDYVERDRQAARNFATVAEQAGVKRIVYLGGLGRDDEEEELSPHLRSRQETGEALRSGPVPVTELRAAVVIGSGSASFTIIRDLARRLPVMVTPAWVRSRCEPIAIRQVLAYLAGVLEEPRSEGEILEIGGGEVFTYEEMMRICAEEMGLSIRMIPVPVLTPRLSSYWLNLVTSVPFSLAKELVEGLRNDVVCTDNRIRDWIEAPALTYREAVRLALEKEGRDAAETRWYEASGGPPLEAASLRGRRVYEYRVVQRARCPAEAVFGVVERIGGKAGWYSDNWLWWLRGAMDRIIGGVGMRLGRPHPEEIRIGDRIDFWRVEDYRPGRVLRLRAEMRVWGVATLEFRVEKKKGGTESRLVQVGRYWPNGWFGRLYWHAVTPLHALVFTRMAKGIVRRAEDSANLSRRMAHV